MPPLITCEHASNRLPKRYRGLGLSRVALDSHIAWDPGAREIARTVARNLRAPCYEGRYSRLLIDLNRSLWHHHLVPKRIFGVHIPGNQSISVAEKEKRIRTHYSPFREAVVGHLRAIIAEQGLCLHLSVHTFAPEPHGVPRHADLGILYDPSRDRELRLARNLARVLRSHGLRVRLNFPYRGTSDGFTTACRKLFPPDRYLGLEIETNQRLTATSRGLKRVSDSLLASLAVTLNRLGPGPGNPGHG